MQSSPRSVDLEEGEDSPSSPEQLIERLNELSQAMNQNVTGALLSQYVSTYIQAGSHPDDAFSTLCEHNFMATLLTAHTQHKVAPIAVLSSFHLLLANTHQLNSLVYIFSQPALQELLTAGLDWTQDEEVEYLVQLLKAIVMRMQGGGKSLIKMFVNTRHPHFPLLTTAIALATHPRHDPLVRVTARQCVLLLAALLDQKDIGRNYLSDIQMAVFNHSLTLQLVRPTQTDYEGLTKFMAELLNALSHTPTAHSLLCNTITNMAVVRQAHDPPKLLSFLRVFTQHLRETSTAPQVTQHTIHLLTSITNKLYFSRFVHSTYLASIKLLPSLATPQKVVDLREYIRERAQRIGEQLLGEPDPQQPAILENWQKFNRNSEEIMRLKDGGGKRGRISSLLGFFAAKITPEEEYLSAVGQAIGINHERLRDCALSRLGETISYRTGLYWVEEALLKQERTGLNIQQFNAHCNDLEGKLELNSSFCLEVASMADCLAHRHSSKEQQGPLRPFQFEELFVQRLAAFLRSNLGDYPTSEQPELTVPQMYHWMSLAQRLGLLGRLELRARRWLLKKAERCQQTVSELTLQHEFKFLLDYAVQNRAKVCFSEPCEPPKHSLLQLEIQQNILRYELFVTFINPQLPSFHEFMLQKWREPRSPVKPTVHWDRNDRQLSIRPSEECIGHEVTLEGGQKLDRWVLGEMDGFISMSEERQVSFSCLPEGFQCKSKHSAQLLVEEVSRLRQALEESMVKWVAVYFETTHARLRASIE